MSPPCSRTTAFFRFNRRSHGARLGPASAGWCRACRPSPLPVLCDLPPRCSLDHSNHFAPRLALRHGGCHESVQAADPSRNRPAASFRTLSDHGRARQAPRREPSPRSHILVQSSTVHLSKIDAPPRLAPGRCDRPPSSRPLREPSRKSSGRGKHNRAPPSVKLPTPLHPQISAQPPPRPPSTAPEPARAPVSRQEMPPRFPFRPPCHPHLPSPTPVSRLAPLPTPSPPSSVHRR